MNDTLTLNACAKINPSLDVTGIRPDGYHEVRMLLQQITLHDTIVLEKASVPGVQLHISPSAAHLPSDRANLAYRAAQLLIDTYHIPRGVRITLEKHIPIAAGLAGGSADAAGVLRGMNALFDLGLSEASLCRHALSLGADVPFCVCGGGALAEGIGEKLTPLPPMPACHILLVKPPEGVSTGTVYHALDAVRDPVHPDIDAALRAYADGNLASLCACMGNILESVTLPMLPRLSGIKSALYEAGAAGAMMSGSGPTMYGLFAQEETARSAQARLKSAYPDCEVILTEPAQSL